MTTGTHGGPYDDFERGGSTDATLEALVRARVDQLRVDHLARERLDSELAIERAEREAVIPKRLDFSKAVRVPKPDALIRTDGVGLMRSKGVIHHIFGDQESGKTTVALVTAIERLRKGETVVWLDWEMGEARLIDRMRSLGFKEADAPFFYFNMAGMSPLSAVAQALACKPNWVFVDSVAYALETMGGDTTENATRDFLALLGMLAPLIEVKASIVLIDHVGHGDKSRARGTSAKGQQVDVSFGMSVVKRWSRTTDGSAHITVRKDRDGYFETGTLAAVVEFDASKEVTLRAPTMYDEAIAAEELQRQIIAIVTDNQPITASGVASIVRRNKAGVLQEIRQLVDEGRLVREGDRGPLTVP